MLDFLVGIEPNLPPRIIDSPDWQAKAQRAVLRFFQLAPHETTGQPVEFRFAHGAAESSEQPIIVLPRVIDAIFVDHQGAGQGTDFNEAIPVATGAGQTGRFSTQDRSRPPQADLSNKILKAVSTGAGGSGAALVLINDDDERFWPSQVVGAFSELVLARCTGGVIADLHEG
jgi:hypothetical protein